MQIIEPIGHLSDHELAMLGVQDVAYVKGAVVDGAPGCAIHAADGTEMALVANRDLAFAIVRQNDLEPVSVH